MRPHQHDEIDEDSSLFNKLMGLLVTTFLLHYLEISLLSWHSVLILSVMSCGLFGSEVASEKNSILHAAMRRQSDNRNDPVLLPSVVVTMFLLQAFLRVPLLMLLFLHITWLVIAYFAVRTTIRRRQAVSITANIY